MGKNIDVSNESGPQSETSIAINPNNGSQIVAGSNEIDRLPMRGYFSGDGGKRWGAVDLPLPPALTNNGFDFGSDPGVAWDTKGNVYYSFIVVFFSSGGAINGTEMAVAKSTDGGKTWPIGQIAFFALETGTASFNDKPMITVDTNPLSPDKDTIYVGWDHASFVNGKPASIIALLVSHSTDGGKTFSTAVTASSTAPGPKGVIGADPFVAPDGTLHVAWQDFQNSLLSESSSADGGLTFGPTHLIAHAGGVRHRHSRDEQSAGTSVPGLRGGRQHGPKPRHPVLLLDGWDIERRRQGVRRPIDGWWPDLERPAQGQRRHRSRRPFQPVAGGRSGGWLGQSELERLTE